MHTIPFGEKLFNRLRKTEYSRLDDRDHVYLDYTGGNIYPQCLLDAHYRFLTKGLYGNPHSDNTASQLSTKHVTETRAAVLKFFNAADYYCVFTNNATAALQIVGECYPFSSDGHLLLTADNHNSVNGIREYCTRKGSSYSYSTMNKEELTVNEECLATQLCSQADKKHKLFAFPAQSNASGVKHSLSWIKRAQEQGWDVLLDAAAFVPTSKLDLEEVQPDFVCLSFYKMFGYPTGLGCLLIKKSSFFKLEKPWFAGGTVSLVSVNNRNHFLLDEVERFENGTVNYLDIPAIANGLEFITKIGIDSIRARVQYLSMLCIEELCTMRHSNGFALIKIYGARDGVDRGGSILLNFFDVDGRQYPCQSIEKMANNNLISLRTGCFCNPGIDEINSGVSSEELSRYFLSRLHANHDDMTAFLGKQRGAIRISVGIPTTKTDIERFTSFARSFIDKTVG